jgi:superfamily II DNA or RNA helicase
LSAWVAQAQPGDGRIQPESVFAFTPRSAYGSAEHPRYVDEQDRAILAALTTQRAESDWSLHGTTGARSLQQTVATGRAFWKTLNGRALSAGTARRADLVWQVSANGDQHLRCDTPDSVVVLLDIEPPMYIDEATAEAGLLELPCSATVVRDYWGQSGISAEQVAAINAQIALNPDTNRFPRLRSIPVQNQPLSGLKARLLLSADPFAALHFIYNGVAFSSAALGDDQKTVRHMTDDVLHAIERDRPGEQRFREQLSQLGPECIPGPGGSAQKREAWLAFMMDGVPQLIAAGWDVAIDERFAFRIATPDEWYGDLDGERQDGWFNLRLVAVVNGKHINLLPALTRLLQSRVQNADKTPQQVMDDPAHCRVGEHWFVLLDDGRYLPIAVERLQRIADTLVELFDSDGLNARQGLSLPASQAARVALLARDLQTPVRHTDDASLRALLEDLEHSDGVQPLQAPPGCNANLRAYQQDGLGWLQFMRRHRLGGILADDMGLGKTVQTLAHLVMEKEQGRLTKPVLIVAPVSVLGNWQEEIRRFAPLLELLVWHGAKRKESAASLGRVDVIITGYSLLQLDSDILLPRDFYLVILDEAQMIKNPRAKVSQVARALRADYRLCLTGTPVENHLGELWSLFDFAQPGLLGDERQFQRYYRTPIEKNGDASRAQALSARLAPYLLRRTKDAVAKDLPPKVEIVETIVLDERQRDLYDAIRLTMHQQVREVVQERGLARSQITILHALLKLRQACCDPRLIEAAGSQESIPSAKLEWLTTVLPQLVAEGRRILLFSQFTSMLSLIEAAVNELSIPYCILTGQTQDRAAVTTRFQRAAVPLFLISLKAGGTGLNLTAADTVIHYDPWWNPAVETQATDRAHRIGQDKSVFVYKLIARNTVEERMLQLQADKLVLSNRLYSQQNAGRLSFNAGDLEVLLGQ